MGEITTTKITAPGDVQVNLIIAAAEDIAIPLTDIKNTNIRLIQWPDINKILTITPAPKSHPTKTLYDLRPKRNLFT